MRAMSHKSTRIRKAEADTYVTYDILESGRSLRSDIGRWIDLGIRMEYYPDDFSTYQVMLDSG